MLRKVRCHTRRCTNTFLTKDGRRRFCDACRLLKYSERERTRRQWIQKSPEWRRKKNEYQKTYRQEHQEALRAYNAEWMKRYRAGEKFRGVGKPARKQNRSFKRCVQCA